MKLRYNKTNIREVQRSQSQEVLAVFKYSRNVLSYAKTKAFPYNEKLGTMAALQSAYTQ